jgi:hypothetical protein
MERPAAKRCPRCGSEGLRYLFAHAGTPIVRCDRCRLVLRNPQPSDAELAAIYTDSYFPGADAGETEWGETNPLKRETATHGPRLRDPFTMFKVFRRDCLYGLTPLTWIRACFKYRFQPLGKKAR